MRLPLKPLHLLVLLLLPACTLRGIEPPTFEAETIDDEVEIGYGVVLGDVDGDKLLDIVLADKRQFVWYRNPDWTRHVLVEDLTPKDNVCIAARDIDGDGMVNIAVGAMWDPSDTVNSGSVHYLEAPKDPTQPWKAIKLPHEPTVHRMRWVRMEDKRFALVVSPLHGRNNRNGEGQGARLLAYYPPKQEGGGWETELLDDSMHQTHNFDVGQWESTPAEELLYIGAEGAKLIRREAGKWQREKLNRIQGGGEIRMGRGPAGRRFIATIEPMHGDKLVVYPSAYTGGGAENRASLADRIVIDESLNQGHAIAVGDFRGVGYDQIVAGWREPNADGKVGLKIYFREARQWGSAVIDDQIAVEDVRVGDLNGDGRPDIVAAGRATKNLKVYWGQPVEEE